MSIKKMSDEALLSQIKLDAASERRHGLAVIHQLREVAARRLDAKLGYDRLHAYCMGELHFSSGSAWRRITAMLALRDIPELETQIQSGQVTVASVSQVESFCRQQNKSTAEKREIFTQIAGLSKRETERVLAEIAPLPERPEKVRILDATTTEIRVTLTAETLAALDHIKNLISHARPNATYAEAIEYLAKLGVKRLDPQILPVGRAKKTEAANVPPEEWGNSTSNSGPTSAPTSTSTASSSSGSCSSVTPAENGTPLERPASKQTIDRIVWRRDGGQCTYVSPGGKKCGGQSFLQKDHIIPKAKGGPYTVKNLRIRCRAHNLLAAVEEFGEAKMTSYIGRQ